MQGEDLLTVVRALGVRIVGLADVISSSRMRQRVWNMKLDMSLGLLLPAKQKFPSE